MGDLRASDVQHLFHVQDYTRLRALVDEGKALHKFCYRADNPNWWGTILGFAVIEKDAFMFQYIVQTCGAWMLSISVDSGIGNGYWALHQMLANDDGTYANKRKAEVMVEIALEQGGTAVYEDMRGMVRLRYIADIYRNSCDARCSSIAAIVWCCQAIREAHGLADGLGELLRERMHAESVWEYEPKIKRAKY